MREPDDAKVSSPVLGGAGRGDAPMPTQPLLARLPFGRRGWNFNSPNFGKITRKLTARDQPVLAYTKIVLGTFRRRA